MNQEGRQLAKTIETERLTLRPFELGDVDDVFAYARDPEFSRYVRMPRQYARGHAEEHVARSVLRDWDSRPRWAIELDGTVIGGLNLAIDLGDRTAELGYGIARMHWGKGLAPEAARAVIDAAFETLVGVNRIWAPADARNLASVRVMEKLGMRPEGILRQHTVWHGEPVDLTYYGLLRGEWEAAATG